MIKFRPAKLRFLGVENSEKAQCWKADSVGEQKNMSSKSGSGWRSVRKIIERTGRGWWRWWYLFALHASYRFGWVAGRDDESADTLRSKLTTMYSSSYDISMTYLGDDASCCNRTTSANCHTRHDDSATSDPTVVLDGDGIAHGRSLTSFSLGGIDGKRAALKIHVRSDHTSRANAHAAGVSDGAVGGDEDIVADGDVVAVVTGERGFDDDSLADTAHRRY